MPTENDVEFLISLVVILFCSAGIALGAFVLGQLYERYYNNAITIDLPELRIKGEEECLATKQEN
jgi:hypothetical protein